MTSRRIWLAVLIAAALARLCTLPAYPLHDTTEARYAEIARLMVVSGNWITPQIDPGIPFWAKPPLSTWLTAASFRLFGFNEFAARLPAFLLILLTALIVFRVGRASYSAHTATIACAVLMSSVLGFIAAGAVMTDAALVAATTLSLASFCRTIGEDGRQYRYGLFVGIGLGLLAKGPLTIVLVGLPVFGWSLWQRNLSWLWRSVPWIKGGLLALVIAGPWYVLAEANSPGFLEYFLIGEHWLRFVDSGWPGDRYGHAHSEPRGTIWLFGIATALPWTLVAGVAVLRWLRRRPGPRSPKPLAAFLLLWMLTPLAFFTFAGNILPAYVLPALPAFALLLGAWLKERSAAFAMPGFIVPAVFAGAGLLGLFDRLDDRSQKDLISYHRDNRPETALHYFSRTPHSAKFYSRGEVHEIESEADLAVLMTNGNNVDIAIRDKDLARLPAGVAACLQPTARVHDYLIATTGNRCRRKNN